MMTMKHCKTQISWSWLELLNSFFAVNEGCFTLSLYYWIVQMSFFIERSIYWRPDALIPAPIYFLIFLQDTLDWASLKKNQKWVFQETNAHKSGHYVF
jgi:hypothetical protein